MSGNSAASSNSSSSSSSSPSAIQFYCDQPEFIDVKFDVKFDDVILSGEFICIKKGSRITKGSNSFGCIEPSKFFSIEELEKYKSVFTLYHPDPASTYYKVDINCFGITIKDIVVKAGVADQENKNFYMEPNGPKFSVDRFNWLPIDSAKVNAFKSRVNRYREIFNEYRRRMTDSIPGGRGEAIAQMFDPQNTLFGIGSYLDLPPETERPGESREEFNARLDKNEEDFHADNEMRTKRVEELRFPDDRRSPLGNSEVVPSSQFYIDMPKFRNIDLSNPVYYSEEGEDAPNPGDFVLIKKDVIVNPLSSEFSNDKEYASFINFPRRGLPDMKTASFSVGKVIEVVKNVVSVIFKEGGDRFAVEKKNTGPVSVKDNVAGGRRRRSKKSKKNKKSKRTKKTKTSKRRSTHRKRT
jgi:hypothetical protein